MDGKAMKELLKTARESVGAMQMAGSLLRECGRSVSGSTLERYAEILSDLLDKMEDDDG